MAESLGLIRLTKESHLRNPTLIEAVLEVALEADITPPVLDIVVDTAEAMADTAEAIVATVVVMADAVVLEAVDITHTMIATMAPIPDMRTHIMDLTTLTIEALAHPTSHHLIRAMALEVADLHPTRRNINLTICSKRPLSRQGYKPRRDFLSSFLNHLYSLSYNY